MPQLSAQPFLGLSMSLIIKDMLKSNWSHLITMMLCILIATSCCDDGVIVEPVYSCNKCELEPMAGNCYAYFPKYYFDKEENKCKEFIWGGCEGVVPFETLEECEECGCTK